MTTISFYNGLREIGGTFVVVETETARCMFDFGFAVMQRMDDKIRVREKDCAADYARLGILAVQDGIYDDYTAKKLGVKSFEADEKKNFFVISHMHIDHMGGLGMLAQELPVYMSEDSLRLYRRLEHCGDIQVRGHKNCIGVPDGESFTVGDITVKAVEVDHDVNGACGFLITTQDGSICYTGDYRFHGFHPEKTRAFGEQMKGADVLITEGVTVSFSDIDMLSLEKPEGTGHTEYWLQEQMKAIAKGKASELDDFAEGLVLGYTPGSERDGLIVINPYNRNVERVHELLKTFASEGRTLVLDGMQADYLKALYPRDEVYIYEETLSYARGRGSSVQLQSARENGFKVVSRKELLESPSKYVLQLDYSSLYELMELKEKTALYVHMDGAPLGDYDPSYAKLKNILEQMRVPYVHLSTGGHSAPYYLRAMVDTIAPGTLIPLHSFRPEQVESHAAKKRVLPEYGDCYELSNGELKRIERKL